MVDDFITLTEVYLQPNCIITSIVNIKIEFEFPSLF